jgi:hypothetical protein
MLSADELGEKGEARFKEICADAGLVYNKSDRDRTGWDFIVEFPFEIPSDVSTPLESRKVPLSCHVQVKTLLEKNDRFKMRLSSAERLAKELKPAFVCVFKVNHELRIVDAYLIHILNKPLGKILKRLRNEDVAGNSTPNKKTISMSASVDGARIALTGDSLRGALVNAVGADLHTYATEKRNQLATLGFEERPYSTEMTLCLSNEDLVDVFLGLKKDVPALQLRTEHTRFGIPVPLPELTEKDATITIQPSAADTCTITVRSDPLSTPAVFVGKIFFPAIPGLPPELGKILFVTDLFSMTVTRRSWAINVKPNLPPQSAEMWAAYWRLAFVMATGRGTIQITSLSKPISSIIEVTVKTPQLDPDQCKYFTEVFERTSSLLRFVGAVDEPKLSMEMISENAQRIITAHGLIHPETGNVTVAFSLISKPGETPPRALSFDMLCVDCLELGDVNIGYYAFAHMVGNDLGDKIEWKSEDVNLKGMMRLHSVPQEYERMIEAAQKETNCKNIFRNDLNRPAP